MQLQETSWFITHLRGRGPDASAEIPPRPLSDLYTLQLRVNHFCSAYKLMKEKLLPRTPKVTRFCLSNELRGHKISWDLTSCSGSPNTGFRPGACSTPHIGFWKTSSPPHLPHQRNAPCTMPATSLRRVSSAVTSPNPHVHTAEIQSCGGKPTNPLSRVEVPPRNGPAFLAQILPVSQRPWPRRKPLDNGYAEIKFCFLRAEVVPAGLTATVLAALAGLQHPSSFLLFQLCVNIAGAF